MELQPEDSVSDPSWIPAVNISRKVGIGAWGISHKNDSCHASSDAGLFSISLPVLPHEKLNFVDKDHSGNSFEDDFPLLNKVHQDIYLRDRVEDIDSTAIGNLLPGDEDELLAGIMDDFDLSGLPSKLEDLDDDLFDSGGGMELDYDSLEGLAVGMSKVGISDGYAGNVVQYGLPNGAGVGVGVGVGRVAGEHPYGEHPSRTLFVRNINSNVEDSELRAHFELYGDIRTLYTACKHRGFVMISYYDIRAAQTAMRALNHKPLKKYMGNSRPKNLDIHYSIPKDNPSEKDINQGTLVAFNLDASISNDDLRQIFGAYGEVKEIRETPHKRHHKFIEFYDVRAAEAALKGLNRCDIAGKRIKLEPSRPGGARRNLMQQLTQELEQGETIGFRHQAGSPLTNSPPGNWTQFGSPVEHNPLPTFSQSLGLGTLSSINRNNLPGLASILPSHVSNSLRIAPIGKDQGGFNQVLTNARSTRGAAYQHSHSYPEKILSGSPGPLSSFSESNSNSSGIGTLSGPQFLWGSPTPYSEQTNSSAWPTSSAGHPFASNGKGHGFPYSNGNGPFLASNHHHHVGSAPSGVPLDRHIGYFPESPETSFMSPSFRGLGVSLNNESYAMNMGACTAMNGGVALPGNMTENGSPNFRMMSLPRHGPISLGNSSFPAATGIEGLTERGRSRRVENSGNQMDSKKLYQLDLDKIINGEDARTTLMIKNIPNKYTSKMLLAAIDESHKDTYDFIYLPIDFKNKCNVGYAFINMVSPNHIIPFYQAFNGKKWEKFNSEKVASLAYARIQGKVALVTHFQNSSLMNEDKWCRPILFHSKGQETDDEVPIPTGNLNVCIREPDGSYSGDSLDSPKDNLDEKSEKNQS